MSEVEKHPFQPFLPQGAKVLLLGSFPPQPKRWSMDFYYPNFMNDMWRVVGLVFMGDKDFFTARDEKGGLLKKFDKEKIIRFCSREGIAMYDTAAEIRRLKDNASDKFLEVVKETDIDSLLTKIPGCRAVVVTGEKAAATLSSRYLCPEPRCGESAQMQTSIGKISLWRLPSTSRAYPLPLVKKSEAYRKMFHEVGMI